MSHVIRHIELKTLVEQAFPGCYVQTQEDAMRDCTEIRVRVFDPRHDQPYHVARKIDRYLLATGSDSRALFMDELRTMHGDFEKVGITFDSNGPLFDGKTASQMEHDKRAPTTAESNDDVIRDSEWVDQTDRLYTDARRMFKREYPCDLTDAKSKPELEPEPQQPSDWGTW